MEAKRLQRNLEDAEAALADAKEEVLARSREGEGDSVGLSHYEENVDAVKQQVVTHQYRYTTARRCRFV